MDYNIISEKVRGVFAKFQGPSYFLEFQIYFPIEKGVEYRSMASSLNEGHRIRDGGLRSTGAKG
jgi:hypothetical protein